MAVGTTLLTAGGSLGVGPADKGSRTSVEDDAMAESAEPARPPELAQDEMDTATATSASGSNRDIDIFGTLIRD